MTVISGLVRRIATEAERQVRGGLVILTGLVRDSQRSDGLERLLAAQGERIQRLEDTLLGQDAGLRAIRAELDSLVAQLNDRLLPRLDERMDDIERDLTMVATGMIRAGKETAAGRAQLDTLERRVSELRAKVSQMEQRAGLWRELQATAARLGDDIDALRDRLGGHPPGPGPVPENVGDHLSDHVAEHPGERVAEALNGGEART